MIDYPWGIPDVKAVANDSSTLPTDITYKKETYGTKPNEVITLTWTATDRAGLTDTCVTNYTFKGNYFSQHKGLVW